VDVAIVGAAAVSLFLELAVIRWQGTVFEFFAFYKNFGLLSCFAGLGLGYALADRDRIPLALVIPLLGWQLALMIGLRFGMAPDRLKTLRAIPFAEQLHMGAKGVHTLSQGIAIYFFLSVIFLLTALAFVPIGQVCGRLMARRDKLRAYGLNLLGSLCGVLLMFLVSSEWTPPVVWFGLSFLVILLFYVRRQPTLLLGVGAAMAAIIILAWPVESSWHRIYSPYQLLELGYSKYGLMVIRAAGQYYQRVLDLSPSRVTGDSSLSQIRAYYELPYRLRSQPSDVAIVGSGCGNDVAAALRSGAKRVDAIEIDPAILMAGRVNHPERPYGDPRVHAVTNDARSFLRTTNRTYDLIVYGLLDSHTLLSQASNVRLDSFVYTVEGLREARARLKPGGLLVLSFSVMRDALGHKIYIMLREAFGGTPPVAVKALYDGSVVFLESREGPFTLPSSILEGTGFEDETSRLASAAIQADASTDDWPFFYMPRRTYPISYLVMVGMVLVASLLLTANFIDERPRFSDLSFFLLGAGFMLVETKAITEMGLTFGNTWQVIGVVIASILIMAFFANSVVQGLNLRRPQVPYLLLLASLGVGWLVAKEGGLPSTTLGRLATAALLTLPMFFSGIVFSTSLSTRGALSAIMAMNLLGAVCGGLLEYNSMYFGFRFLYLLAIGLYAMAFVHSLTVRHVVAPVGSVSGQVQIDGDGPDA
jgi:spermidine synthase